MDASTKELNNIELRPVTDDDREFLLSVYAAGREAELALVAWDDTMKRTFIEHQFTAQDAHYQSRYPASTHDVILVNGDRAGRVYIERSDTQIAILDIGVLPPFRRMGIAAHVVQGLQAEAGPVGKSIRIFIETFNPAQKLFGELGFEMVEDDGGLRRFEWRAK